ncbi:MAG: hypothetical protein L0G22_07195 [Propionibacteriaceae bacterium]|nr:hypothetical protein [Propionibacteriaceae bacterium]
MNDSPLTRNEEQLKVTRSDELIWMTTRTPDNIVVNLEDEDIAEMEIEYTD